MPAPLDVVVSATAPEEQVPPPVPPTLEEIQAIQDAAYREGLERGLAEGHAEGFAQGQAEVRRLAAQMEGILDNFSRPLDRLENEVVAALSELAVRIAGALVGRAYQTDPVLLQELATTALDAVGGAQREVELRLHPDDIAALTPVLAMTAHTRLTADTSLTRGDLRVHAESVRIDGTLEARLRGALETVLNRSARA
ncbi:FliH/SctL family protein [Pseudoxanthomonas mexicana]|uniref:FliH/SctL family protein n=1 Tax=Pseudoxanthomonas mexicana TaxID=128785 RepID=UPI0022F3E584|nr:FliH/SctL family protein [Pseudoxanthomonas mexicana]MCA0299335.1 flagellar assembly protein FliH [Pseudomonadota bacterium]WBX95441.1 FliH/SctL family protein [Pseudoxanthomonas mexicana]